MESKGYTVLNEETLPTFLKGKPPVIICLIFAFALIILTILSVTIGVVIGYTYCYLEHHQNMKSGVQDIDHLANSVKTSKIGYFVHLCLPRKRPTNANITRNNLKIVPFTARPVNKTRTINDALLNNYYVSQILRFCGLRDKAPVEGMRRLAKVA